MNFARQQPTYVDAVELCRLGCKAIVLEKFDSARRYFELAAEQGCLEAAVSLEVLFNQGYIEPFVLDEYSPAQTPYPSSVPVSDRPASTRPASSQNYIQPRQTSANSYMIEVPAGLQFKPNVQLSYYSH
ncbi:MAG: hypothetical protein WC028_01835 [Candidatus Obscuribacterales bacterium]